MPACSDDGAPIHVVWPREVALTNQGVAAESTGMRGRPRVDVIVPNWNTAHETADCLEALASLQYESFDVVVVDNASTDDSISVLESWLDSRGTRRQRVTTTTNPASDATFVGEWVLERGSGQVGCPAMGEDDDKNRAIDRDTEIAVTLLRSMSNSGYAGANNDGLRWSLCDPGYGCFWLLNNDCIPAPDALTHLVLRMEGDPRIGMCGSTLLSAAPGEIVQTLAGGRFWRVLAYDRFIGAGRRLDELPSTEWVESRLSYVMGASLLVSRDLVERVGLMDERYFMYHEEVDWAIRGAAAGFRCAYARASVVRHFGGAATKVMTGSKDGTSLVSDYYGVRGRMLIAAKLFPACLPTVALGVVYSAMRRAIRGQWTTCLLMLRVVVRPRSMLNGNVQLSNHGLKGRR